MSAAPGEATMRRTWDRASRRRRAAFGQPTVARRHGLIRVIPDTVIFQMGIWIVMHENLRASRRMRLMFDHLVDGVTSYIKEGRDW